MPIVSYHRFVLYLCGTPGTKGNLSEWDDSFPSLSRCDPPKCLNACFARLVYNMTNKLFTRTNNCDHMLHTVAYMRCTTAVCCRCNCDPSVLVAVHGALVVPYVPTRNLFSYVVFDGGGRSRRSVRSNHRRTVSVVSVSCVSRHFGRRLHLLLRPANTCVSTSPRSASVGPGVGICLCTNCGK